MRVPGRQKWDIYLFIARNWFEVVGTSVVVSLGDHPGLCCQPFLIAPSVVDPSVLPLVLHSGQQTRLGLGGGEEEVGGRDTLRSPS